MELSRFTTDPLPSCRGTISSMSRIFCKSCKVPESFFPLFRAIAFADRFPFINSKTRRRFPAPSNRSRALATSSWSSMGGYSAPCLCFFDLAGESRRLIMAGSTSRMAAISLPVTPWFTKPRIIRRRISSIGSSLSLFFFGILLGVPLPFTDDCVNFREKVIV